MYLFGPLSPPGLPAAHLRCLHTLHGGQGDQGAGWQAGRPTKCQGSRLVTQAWKVFLRLANLRPWLFFFGVQPFFTRTSPTTSGHVFCSEEWSKCVYKLLWESQTGKYAQESDSMTRRVNRFTNTTKSTIYKFVEACGNY